MSTAQWVVMAAKRLANVVVEPTWCSKCGSRLGEQPVGFREQGSYYVCPKSGCPAEGLPALVLGL